MELPSWGDLIQVASTVVVAIVLGWWVDRRYAHRSSIKTVLCRELQDIVLEVREYERRVGALYAPGMSDYGREIKQQFSDYDITLRRIEILRQVISSKLNSSQLPEFRTFHAAYLQFDLVLRSMDVYFGRVAPVSDRDARLDVSGPVHTMIASQMRVEIMAG